MKKEQNINKRIKELQNELNSLRSKKKKEEKKRVGKKVKSHNRMVVNGSKEIVEKLIDKVTGCELRFSEVVKAKGLDLKFQYPIYINYKGKIIKYFVVDFCDVENKIIIEVDGGYHFDLWQKDFDNYRESMLRSKGYKIFRISNDDVLAEKSTALLFSTIPDFFKIIFDP